MVKYKIEKRDYEVFESITCDICKKEFFGGIDDMEIQEFLSIRGTGGFGSVFGDGERINYDFCQHCIFDFIKGAVA